MVEWMLVRLFGIPKYKFYILPLDGLEPPPDLSGVTVDIIPKTGASAIVDEPELTDVILHGITITDSFNKN